MILLLVTLGLLFIWHTAGGEIGDTELANDNHLLTFISDDPIGDMA